MQYDFTTVWNRAGHDSLAVDSVGADNVWAPDQPKEGFDFIPMWVADMGFATMPGVVESMRSRLEHPIFGYFEGGTRYTDAITRWQEHRNGVTDLKPEYIGYQNSVLGGLAAAMEAVCARGDKVLIHAPTYTGFTNTLTNLGYKLIHSTLKRDEAGVWRMDYEEMEQLLNENHIHVAVFCSPHNPSGRVWEQWELEKAMELFQRYQVTIISDEIWSDILLNGHTHIPTQQVSEYAKQNTVALYAPSKTFNLAGLVGSYHIIYNDALRHRVEKVSSLSHYNQQNLLSMYALLGAYTPEGEQWVDQLRQTLSHNVNWAYEFIQQNFKGVTLAKPQGSYLLFLDCSQYCEEKGITLSQLIKAGWDVGVGWQDGRPFHGATSIRMNLALPFSQVETAFQRLKDHVFVD